MNQTHELKGCNGPLLSLFKNTQLFLLPSSEVYGLSLVGLGQNFKTVPFVKPFRSSTVRRTNGFTVPFVLSPDRSVPKILLRTVTSGTERSMNGQRTV